MSARSTDQAMRRPRKAERATGMALTLFLFSKDLVAESQTRKLWYYMKYSILLPSALVLSFGVLTSCGSQKLYLETVTPQEQSLQLTKISDENQNPVIGNLENVYVSNWTTSGYGKGGDKKHLLLWGTGSRLAISPDGSQLAYISFVDNNFNIMVRKTTSGSPSTQRTFRRAQNVDWGEDNLLYFNDNTGSTSTIGSTDSRKGSLVKTLTNNNNDWEPALTADGSILYFTRFDSMGPSIWMLNRQNGELTNCTRGYGPKPVGKSNSQIVCTRNSVKGNSEIWLIDLSNGDETIILSDSEKGFTDASVSPDGNWILCVSNSLSNINNKQNTDIYAAKIDGTGLTQITYHPEVDCSPVWSKDGNYIYFISSRANKDRKFNIWRINNPFKYQQ